MADIARFSYRAADGQGQRIEGVVAATDQHAALEVLNNQGLRVFEIGELAALSTAASGGRSGNVLEQALRGRWLPSPRSGSISEIQRVWLFDELATLLESGVVLVEAIDGLQSSDASGPLGLALADVNVRLRSGAPLSVALRESSLRLPRYVTELVRAGESTGRLAGAARAAAQQQLAEFEFSREVRNALVYPSVLVGSGVLAMLVVFVFVVPKFATILDNPKADLPVVSLWVLQGGTWLAAHLSWVAAGMAVVVATGVWAARQVRARQWAWELAGRLPFIGAWVVDAEAYRWSSMLALLTQNKVNLLEGLAQANGTLRGDQLAARGRRVADAVRQGKSLATALEEQSMLDRSALSLVRVGEKSGTLDRALLTLANRYRAASQQRVKRFLVILEPITILLISMVLGGIMISVILAVTSITNVIG